jgi:hypothetical protein
MFQNVSANAKLAVILISSALVVACGSGSSTSSNSSQPIYTGVFDAGSSGTRLSFFKVIPSPGGYPVISKIATIDKDIDGVVKDDGINDFLNGNGSIKLENDTLPPGCPRTTDLGQYNVEACVLQPHLAQLDQEIAKLNTQNPGLNLTRAQVKLEMFATAGMRTEDERNGGSHSTAAIEQYYGQMKAYVAQWGYSTGEFKTINGNSEEGVWTWINLNDYYFNAFGGNPAKSALQQAPVGDFEVGGSSMQIAFPTGQIASDAANVYRVSINGRSFNVYSKTFLGLGGDDTRKYVKAFNYNQQDGAANCYAVEATVNNTKESSGVQLYPSNQVTSVYPFPTNAGVLTVPWTTLVASSLNLNAAAGYNFDGCSGKYNTIASQVTALNRNRYGTFNEGAIATIDSFKAALQNSMAPFVGIDNFYYTAADLKYAPATGFQAIEFKTKLLNYCGKKVAIDSKFAQDVCPNGTYMYDYLFGANGLFKNSTATFAGVLSPRDNGDTVLTWTRGYLLQKYSR